jgi:hypothetical protein
MNKGVAVPLESYRLAEYANQLPCYICQRGNTYDAELCRHCFAPMALAHQANSQKILPKMIAAIGSSGVGKTVYLGMLLDMLSRQPDRMHAVARGAFSITLQQTTLASLSRCEFPAKTPSEPDRWNWVHCQVRTPQHRQPLELIMPDMAGEALFEEIEHPHTYQVIRSLLEKCTGVMVLIDAATLHGGVLDQDYASMKILSYLSELAEDPKKGLRNRPIALVVSKADQCEHCFDDPMGYAQKHAPGLWQYCHQRFNCYQFFAAGVAGSCAVKSAPGRGTMRVPLRIEPRGIIEPFEWLVNQIKQ